MKKAFLATYTITTRVVVDIDDKANPNPNENDGLFEDIDYLASEKIRKDFLGYVGVDNLEVVEDTECPYGTLEN